VKSELVTLKIIGIVYRNSNLINPAKNDPMTENTDKFTEKLLTWFDQYGRHDLPWQHAITPYRVWVSEIMLQQTQVKTVIPYFERFMQSFPNLQVLASASQDEVLGHWAGLGYYARGRNLHKAAVMIRNEFEGEFPATFDEILSLPGIGRSTAGAILSISLGQRQAILDGNVKRVLSRYLALEGWPGEKNNEQKLWSVADLLTPDLRFNDYTQAIMDLGATLCTRSKPQCGRCPVAESCEARQQDRVTEFPFSKPKKIKPIKKSYFLILENQQGQVLLQQRPQKGIWGGLWSFPEYSCLQSCQTDVKRAETETESAQSLVEWEVFRHTFSHYHLDIHPVMYQGVSENSMQFEGEWVHKQQLCQAEVSFGVPAPISKIMTLMEK
jgi:A/G-specific adenine glycosylase